MHGVMKYLVLFWLLYTALAILDLAWIGGIAKNFYLSNLKSYLRSSNGTFSPRILPALILYGIIVIGSLCFVIVPYADSSLLQVFVIGLFYGFVVYSVYEMTNYSIMPSWPLSIVVVDIIWGTVLNGILGVLGRYLINIL